MTAKRHFIGWDRHATETVRDFLIPNKISESIDLGETLIVVPTRQASRRLRESMATHCAVSDAALLSAQVCVPNAFFRPEEHTDYRETTGLLTRSIWSNILQNSSASDFSTLFPATIDRNQVWAERTGDILQNLRETLADGGHTIQSVISDHEEILEEAERWHDLADAEQHYLARVKELGYKDATLRKIEKSENPTIPDGITRIVVASVPDPSLLMIRALDLLKETIPIDILILAPENQSNMFDKWGRPIPTAWLNKQIDIPDSENNIHLTGTPKAQSNLAIQSIAAGSSRFGPGDIAIGVPDRSVIPFLETNLTEMGLNAFDPAEKFLKDHPIFGLLDLFVSLCTTRTYVALRNLMRHPDMLAYLKTENINPTKLLTELDKFQNKYLPTQLEDLKRAPETSKQQEPLVIHSSKKDNTQKIDAMLALLHPLLNLFDKLPPDEAIRSLLQVIYKDRMLSSKNSADQAFIAAGEKTTEILREFASCTQKTAKNSTNSSDLSQYRSRYEAAGTSPHHPHPQTRSACSTKKESARTLHHSKDQRPATGDQQPSDQQTNYQEPILSSPSLSILIKTLSEQTYHADREDSQIDLDGWLELPWNNAPFLIATGMNEGRVPDGHLSDMFLPDSLRHQLKLRNDAGRLARDAYLMTLLIETRRKNGKTIFIAGKISTTGDPLKPSRLLFRCPQAELVPRAKKLFAHIDERKAHHASTISFKLDVKEQRSVSRKCSVGRLGQSASFSERDKNQETSTKNQEHLPHISVTAFRSYLACPFRFYLSNILHMRALDDSKCEMDAMDFGSMIHAALQCMGETNIWQQDNVTTIADFLISEAEHSISLQFSTPPPMPVQIALDSARQRLRQAAYQQVELTRNGWDIIRAESRCEMTIENTLIRGTIDRVDKNRNTGAIRIIDYKTSDKEIFPLKAHIAGPHKDSPNFAQLEIEGKPKRWIDLQLPLYQYLLQADGLSFDNTELAYFNLPKAVTQTGIYIWDKLTPSIITSAQNCAKQIIQNIRANNFWPPAENLKHDDFAKLFPASPKDCFTPIIGDQRSEDGDNGGIKS